MNNPLLNALKKTIQLYTRANATRLGKTRDGLGCTFGYVSRDRKNRILLDDGFRRPL